MKRQFDDYLTVFKGKAKDQIAKCTKQIQFCKNSILAFPLVIFDYLIFHMAVTKKDVYLPISYMLCLMFCVFRIQFEAV